MLLFFILMTLGYFYVRALSHNEQRSTWGMTLQNSLAAKASPQAARWLALGWPFLPAVHAPLYRRADGLDGADIYQIGLRGHGVSAGVVAERADAGELSESARSAEQRRPGFSAIFWNSLFVSTLTTILAVLVAVPAAYAFSRFSFPGRNFLFFSVLLRNMFPAVIFLVPLFILMRFLGLVNTHGSLVLTYLTFGLPLAIWLLKGFYDNIPIQLEQAARIDGATRLQAFILIVMPLSVPGIIATAIYSFIGAWNEYIYAYTFLSKNDQLTLPVGIQRFFSENTTDFPGLMAASFMMSVPVVVLFLVLQKYFVRALTEGAVKH